MGGPQVQVPKQQDGCGIIVAGDGAAVADTVIEQDASYWEVKVLDPGTSCKIGVSRDLQGMWLESQIGDGESSWALDQAKVPLKADDIVGVYFGQDDLPNLRFSLNGSPLEDASIKKVRGEAYPAVSVGGGAKVMISFEAKLFQHPPVSCHTEIN